MEAIATPANSAGSETLAGSSPAPKFCKKINENEDKKFNSERLTRGLEGQTAATFGGTLGRLKMPQHNSSEENFLNYIFPPSSECCVAAVSRNEKFDDVIRLVKGRAFDGRKPLQPLHQNTVKPMKNTVKPMRNSVKSMKNSVKSVNKRDSQTPSLPRCECIVKSKFYLTLIKNSFVDTFKFPAKKTCLGQTKIK